MAAPFAVDFGAVMTVGAARGVDAMLLAEVLPDVERAIIGNLHDEPSEAGDDYV